tara:strand:- start:256 stop:897 length:642 start_codon:yes stop_codon:yes gene_type:complete
MVIFDMAGTTINEGGLVYKTLKDTLWRHNIFYTEEEFDKFHGVSKKQVLKHFIEKTDSDVNIDTAYRWFEDNLIKNYSSSNSIKVMDGTFTLFNKLREDDIKICLNTGYPRNIAEHILDNVGIEIGVHIDDLITSSEVPIGRPAPYMINHLMKKYGVSPSYVAKVGDTVADIREGQNAHVKYQIGVLSGADDRETLEKANPHLIVNSVKDLIQ